MGSWKRTRSPSETNTRNSSHLRFILDWGIVSTANASFPRSGSSCCKPITDGYC